MAALGAWWAVAFGPGNHRRADRAHSTSTATRPRPSGARVASQRLIIVNFIVSDCVGSMQAGSSGIPLLPQRPAANVVNRAFKELGERQAKAARRQSRRRRADAVRPLTALDSVPTAHVTSQSGDAIHANSDITTASMSPCQAIHTHTTPSSSDNGDRALGPSLALGVPDALACMTQADTFLLMRDRTSKGIITGLATDVASASMAAMDDALSDTSELTDLDELERQVTWSMCY
ncbi:hypothetical protein GSI_08927 [Ganoderma sinense ZZ0214-1]|uniref:Uncharacterized protein n=1 Tax=Ganoderma sinense ZZ0214-1 TaxID=1077348 RepID=A0A2G8S547_9APHY|nr:hypothetical protein GSI_08927 [Ganoderma sinense ZZ0214-1]